MRAVNAIALGAVGFSCVVLLSGCNQNSFFNKFKAHASVYYYNQITSNGAADQSALTNTFYVDANSGDSVANQGYSNDTDAGELQPGLDKNDVNNGVRVRGVSSTGATLFSDRARFAKNGSYVAVAYGDTTSGSVNVGVFTQDESSVASGSSRFRVINTVNSNILGIFSVDLRIANKSTTFVDGLGMGKATDYQTVDNGTLRIQVLNDGAMPEQIIDTVQCNLSGGRAYDVILAAKDPLNPPTDPANASGTLALYCHRQAVP